jgi:hypothetical protein
VEDNPKLRVKWIAAASWASRGVLRPSGGKAWGNAHSGTPGRSSEGNPAQLCGVCGLVERHAIAGDLSLFAVNLTGVMHCLVVP